MMKTLQHSILIPMVFLVIVHLMMRLFEGQPKSSAVGLRIGSKRFVGPKGCPFLNKGYLRSMAVLNLWILMRAKYFQSIKIELFSRRKRVSIVMNWFVFWIIVMTFLMMPIKRISWKSGFEMLLLQKLTNTTTNTKNSVLLFIKRTRAMRVMLMKGVRTFRQAQLK